MPDFVPFETFADAVFEEDQKRLELQERQQTLELTTINFDGVNIIWRLPTSSEGLNPGELWADNRVLKVVE